MHLTFPTGVVVILAAIQLASFLLVALVAYNFRSTMKTRQLFFAAVAGGHPVGLFLFCRTLLTTYVVIIILVTVIIDLLFIFQPHIL